MNSHTWETQQIRECNQIRMQRPFAPCDPRHMHL
jgi:hypothetical protein